MLAVRNTLTSYFVSCQKSFGFNPTLCFSSFTQPLFFRSTPWLMAEPMKRKKKADPALIKLREDRKRKKLWRDIKRLMRLQNQLKPIDELEVPYAIVDDPQKYARKRVTLSEDELNARDDLRRQWSVYKMRRHAQDLQMIERIEAAQEKALRELEQESPSLYMEAVKVDDTFLPLTVDGPTDTPPIKDYDSPDGDYVDSSRTWEPPVIPEMDKKLKKQRLELRAAAEEAKKKEEKKKGEK